MNRDNVRKLFSKIDYFRTDRRSVSFLFHGHANKRVPEFPTDSFSMLAIAHGVLLFSDIAVAQEVQHRIPRALIDIEQVSRPIRPLHMPDPPF
jgi:hypothetical protein